MRAALAPQEENNSTGAHAHSWNITVQYRNTQLHNIPPPSRVGGSGRRKERNEIKECCVHPGPYTEGGLGENGLVVNVSRLMCPEVWVKAVVGAGE